MSEIEAIEKLRESSHLDDNKWTLENGEVVTIFGADPTDQNAVNWGEQWRKIADEIEAEIAERFMLAPVDADGAPIHMGDTVEGELLDGSTVRGTVSAFHLYDNEPDSVYIHVDVSGGCWTIKELRLTRCRHYKPRTVEDVLMDVMSDFADADFNDETIETITARYAAELRELLGGDAE